MTQNVSILTIYLQNSGGAFYPYCSPPDAHIAWLFDIHWPGFVIQGTVKSLNMDRLIECVCLRLNRQYKLN